MQQHNPLRLIASSAALTRTHVSYPSHSSSSVVFGAAKTCRNTSGVADGRSGAQRKDRTVAGAGCQEVRQANPTTPTHASNPKSTQNRVPKETECVCCCWPSHNLSTRHTETVLPAMCPSTCQIPATTSVLAQCGRVIGVLKHRSARRPLN